MHKGTHFLLFALSILPGAANALPNITAWSTNGTNASTPQDLMFLAGTGEQIYFNLTLSDASNITVQWLVNKQDQGRNANNFTFTVPYCDRAYDPTGCIWEIHAAVNDTAGNEAHKEWVVSNLSLSEAPYLFDSFTDGGYANRSMEDPWGRPLPAWNKSQDSAMDVSMDRGYARTTGLIAHTTSTSDNVQLKTSSSASNGTWFIRYRWWPNDSYTGAYNSWTGIDVSPIISTNNTAYTTLYNVIDGHWWFAGGPSNISRNYFSYPYVNMVGSQIGSAMVTGTGWHNITLVRDEDGYYYTYLDGAAVGWSMDRNVEIPDSEYYAVNLRTHSPYALEIDDVQIYKNRYLPPNPAIYYNASEGATIINGHNVTLERIAQAVGNESILNYTPATRTGTAYRDLKIMPGTNFHLKDSTLRMRSNYDGERKIYYGNDVNLIVANSTITSDTGYYFLFSRFGLSLSNIAFQFVNSTINNTGGLTNDAVDSLFLSGCNLTNLAGSTPIYLYFRIPTHKLLIENCRFTGRTGTESIVLQGGMQFEQVYPYPPGLNMINTVFENITLFRRYDWPYTYSNCRPLGIANLINSDAASKSFSGTVIRNKYYLDVLASNGTGSPQEGVVISVVNNADNENHTSENLRSGQSYIMLGDQYDYENCYANDNYQYFWAGPPTNKGQLTNNIPAWVRMNQHRTGMTGADGHTPPPNDTTGTFLLTDSVEDGSTTRNFTYNITAHKLAYSGSRIATINNPRYPERVTNLVHPNGTVQYENGAIIQIGTASNIDPNSSWYRQNPNEYNNTVQITLEDTDAFFFNLTARPASAPVRVIIGAYNFSAISGSQILNFTANTSDGNEVNFTLCGLRPAAYHSIRRDNSYFMTRASNSTGCINFSTASWSSHSFGIKETQPPNVTILSPRNITYGSGWVQAEAETDENASWCGASLDGSANQSMNMSDPRRWYLNISVPSEGGHNLTVSCNNTVGYFGDSVRRFSIDTLSGCYPPNSGNWLINRTLYCQDNAVMLSPNLTIGSNGSATFNASTLLLGAVHVSKYGNLTLLRTHPEASITGNLTVKGTMAADSSNLLLNGNANVYGNLTLKNLTLRMNATETWGWGETGYYNININTGAHLHADGANITRGENGSVYWGRLWIYGTMLMNNSNVEYTSGGNVGGVYIKDPTNRTSIHNSMIFAGWGNLILAVDDGTVEFRNMTSGEQASYALESEGANSVAIAYDSRLLSTADVSYGGRIYLINTSMGNTWHGTGGGEIWRRWYFDVHVTDPSGSPLDQANVTAWNVSGQQAFTNMTGQSGYIQQQVLTEYAQINSSGCGSNCQKRYATPHNLTVSKSGYATATMTINITNSTLLGVTLSPLAAQQNPSGGGGSWGGGATQAKASKTIRKTPPEPLTGIVAYLKEELENADIIPENLLEVPLPPPPGIVYQYLRITRKNFNSTQMENATIEFRVNLTWISKNGVREVRLSRYGKGWEKLPTVQMNATEKHAHYSAYTEALSYFAITGEQEAAPQQEQTPAAPAQEEKPPDLNAGETEKAPARIETGDAKAPPQKDTAKGKKAIEAAIAALSALALAGYIIDHYAGKSALPLDKVEETGHKKVKPDGPA